MPLFQPGQCANPHGRPKGSVGGRARALMVLDVMMGEEKNIARLHTALQAEFDKNPVRFFKSIIMPLLPQDVRVRLGEEGAIKWASLLTTFPTEPSASSITIDVTDSAPSAVAEGGAKPVLPPPSCSTSPENAADSSPG